VRRVGNGRSRRAARSQIRSRIRQFLRPVAVLVVLGPIAALLSGIPAEAAGATGGLAPRGWVAHSAYGLQISVPRSWATAYFADCPRRGPGTLLIGTPMATDFCAYIPAGTDIVTMQPEKSEAVLGSDEKNLVVHGLLVTSYSVGGVLNWDVRSKDVVLTATGPRALAVLNTLAPATPHARAAPGILEGTEYLEAMEQTPVTGQVSLSFRDAKAQAPSTVHAYDGHFSATLAPGRYRLTGHAGDAPCPPVAATVESGQVRDIPAIDCQGE
jgi:hypothetical protein